MKSDCSTKDENKMKNVFIAIIREKISSYILLNIIDTLCKQIMKAKINYHRIDIERSFESQFDYYICSFMNTSFPNDIANISTIYSQFFAWHLSFLFTN